ncbi:MAG TPA: undecaprenyl-diphosphate phosphatase [Solirubrobacteraceae bacterium]|jgi:undecaprenyl-diphosphatase|nr:undecaprenyl-diphosphate phosphatase [Solirubrobacteraceae bacterium]
MLTAASAHLVTTFQAIVLGVLQGATELFPVSSLGHTVLFPTLFRWHNIVAWQSQSESPWLAFVVMLHVGSAIGLLIYFWRTWIAVIKGFFVSLWRTIRLRRFAVESSTERLAWLIVIATIPVGILGLLLEHPVRVALAKPLAAAIFLMFNGCILLSAERLRRRSEVRALAQREGVKADGGRRLDTLEYREAGVIGTFQTLALIAGISRDGIVMTSGLLRGLDNEDAARFGFLLATPPILAAGLLKFPDLTGKIHLGHGYATAAQAHNLRIEAVVALAVSAVIAVVTVHFLTRYFKARNLVPFGIYCLAFGAFMTLFTIIVGTP